MEDGSNKNNIMPDQDPEVVVHDSESDESDEMDMDAAAAADKKTMDSDEEDDDDDSADSLNSSMAKQDMTLAAIEQEIIECIQEGNPERLQALFKKTRSSQMLQTILTFSHPNRPPILQLDGSRVQSLALIKGGHSATPSSEQLNNSTASANQGSATMNQTGKSVSRRTSVASSSSMQSFLQRDRSFSKDGAMAPVPYFGHDPDVQEIASALLGASVSPLNFLQIACMVGEEEIALTLLDFVYKYTHKGQKLLLFEFLGRTWGDSNTVLHLAAFQGMSELVERLLQYGATPGKRNGRGYKAVDCADDDNTLRLFRNINQIERLVQAPTRARGNSLNSQQERPKLTRKESAPSQIETTPGNVGKPSVQQQPALNKVLEDASNNPVMPTGGLKKNKKNARIGWDRHTLLLDLCKTGELERVKEMFGQYKIVKDHRQLPEDPREIKDNHTELHINRPTAQGLTAMHMACSYGHMAIAQLLLANGAAVNARDREGFTPLHAMVAEIPPPPIKQPSNMNAAAQKKIEDDKKKRVVFLEMLKWFLTIENVNLRLVTEDGESVLDVVGEDDNGRVDSEVSDILEKEFARRNVDLDKLADTEDPEDNEHDQQESEEGESVDEQSSTPDESLKPLDLKSDTVDDQPPPVPPKDPIPEVVITNAADTRAPVIKIESPKLDSVPVVAVPVVLEPPAPEPNVVEPKQVDVPVVESAPAVVEPPIINQQPVTMEQTPTVTLDAPAEQPVVTPISPERSPRPFLSMNIGGMGSNGSLEGSSTPKASMLSLASNNTTEAKPKVSTSNSSLSGDVATPKFSVADRLKALNFKNEQTQRSHDSLRSNQNTPKGTPKGSKEIVASKSTTDSKDNLAPRITEPLGGMAKLRDSSSTSSVKSSPTGSSQLQSSVGSIDKIRQEKGTLGIPTTSVPKSHTSDAIQTLGSGDIAGDPKVSRSSESVSTRPMPSLRHSSPIHDPSLAAEHEVRMSGSDLTPIAPLEPRPPVTTRMTELRSYQGLRKMASESNAKSREAQNYVVSSGGGGSNPALADGKKPELKTGQPLTPHPPGTERQKGSAPALGRSSGPGRFTTKKLYDWN